MIKSPRFLIILSALTLSFIASTQAKLTLPTIISDHMVLQQKQSDPIWGWDTPGTKVTVSFAGKSYDAAATSDGKWMIKLDAMPANAIPQTMTISGSSQKKISDILIGEVWVCSGQSNMQFSLARDDNGDLEANIADFPQIRLITVPPKGTQKLLNDFKGQWETSNSKTSANFSAIGFFFARYLHMSLHVPVGMINDSWGGSAAEAFIPRAAMESMASDPLFKPLMDRTHDMEAKLLPDNGNADFAAATAKYQEALAKAKAEGKRPPNQPTRYLEERARPGNNYGGMIHPIVGFGIKGIIWYQGEANGGRGYEYAALFPFLIEQWRKEWNQGDFPFYWVQLPKYGSIKSMPGESNWAELREAQSKTMKLPNTGQAVIIDMGEPKDIHPHNKHDVAPRLLRWALAKNYGMNIAYRSPEFQSMAINSNKAIITIDCFKSKLRPFGVEEAQGFAICGADKKWQRAEGKVTGTNTVEVWNDQIATPIAVRYAWADSPECNLFSETGLPVTPFRTDDFSLSSKPKPTPTPSPTP